MRLAVFLLGNAADDIALGRHSARERRAMAESLAMLAGQLRCDDVAVVIEEDRPCEK